MKSRFSQCPTPRGEGEHAKERNCGAARDVGEGEMARMARRELKKENVGQKEKL